MTNWKAIAVFGVAGFLLSLLFGLFSGNPFGVVVLRVVLSTVGAGGLGFGLLFVVDRFLPELSVASGGEDGMAGHVDIVIPGENPHEAGLEASPDEATDVAPEGDASQGPDRGPPEEGLEGSAPGSPADLEATEPEEVAAVDELSPADGGIPGAGGAEVEPLAVGAGPLGGDMGSPPSAGGLDSLDGAKATVTAGGQQHDAETVAKALRTMMKRDEEG